MTIRDFLDYEIRSSWWGWMIWWGWGQSLAARYFAWKTKRKYNRYIDSRFDKAMIELMRQCQDETPNVELTGWRGIMRQSAWSDELASTRTKAGTTTRKRHGNDDSTESDRLPPTE